MPRTTPTIMIDATWADAAPRLRYAQWLDIHTRHVGAFDAELVTRLAAGPLLRRIRVREYPAAVDSGEILIVILNDGELVYLCEAGRPTRSGALHTVVPEFIVLDDLEGDAYDAVIAYDFGRSYFQYIGHDAHPPPSSGTTVYDRLATLTP